jgi:transcriptional regulator with XRE-family HTH domain
MRDAKGYTQKQVADLAGISRSYYSGIELGTRNAPAATAKKIASALGFEWTIFFANERRKTSHKQQKPA